MPLSQKIISENHETLFGHQLFKILDQDLIDIRNLQDELDKSTSEGTFKVNLALVTQIVKEQYFFFDIIWDGAWNMKDVSKNITFVESTP